MEKILNDVLKSISEEFKNNIYKGARNYLQIEIGERAAELGYRDLKDKYKLAGVVVPIKNPLRGMKVRIDGRTFVRYAQYSAGIAVPDFVAKAAGLPFEAFKPKDSMILNFH